MRNPSDENTMYCVCNGGIVVVKFISSRGVVEVSSELVNQRKLVATELEASLMNLYLAPLVRAREAVALLEKMKADTITPIVIKPSDILVCDTIPADPEKMSPRQISLNDLSDSLPNLDAIVDTKTAIPS
ncbi:MAG: hypothetical protein MUD10_01175 [Candidatus Pacebacteria bacterium]|nr:hypothetical protein [Candidatus Paceibacterota bacterium]